MFRNTGANAFAKNQMRLAYEDKRDLYCRDYCQNSSDAGSPNALKVTHKVEEETQLHATQPMLPAPDSYGGGALLVPRA